MVLPSKGGNQSTLCLKLDFVPLWLAKINITPAMQADTPELGKRLEAYQLNTKDALAKHVDPEDKRQDDGVAICDLMGREQHPTIINESGLYSPVLSSKLPTARKS